MRMKLILVMRSGLSLLAILLFLCSRVSALGSVVSKGYHYHHDHLSWKDAQRICRRIYTDLATIFSQSDSHSLNLKDYYAWIGYQKELLVWHWSNYNSHSLTPEWAQFQMDNDKQNCASIRHHNKKLYSEHCDTHWFFYCTKQGSNLTFIPQSKKWSEAEKYCEDKFDHLGVFFSASDQQNIKEQDFPVWTGLHRDGQEWKWSSEDVSEYRKWASKEPSSNGDCVAISSLSKQMTVRDCNARFPYVCYRDNVVLVKEKKTWEHALEHCRNLELSGRSDYELLSVQPGQDHSYLMDKIMTSDTEKVWVGLRFLAGEWLWVNGADLQYTHLPTCPIEGKHCAAFSRKNTGEVETTDCEEQLNFLCYRPA